MLSSKANAALARLKEIEEKYKTKRKEQKWKEDSDSSISSVSIVPSENPSAESPRKAMRSKINIKMPDTRFEGHPEETKLLSRSERLMPDKADAFRPAEDVAEIDLDVAMPLNDKSPRSAGKHESLTSDIMTIQENSFIESVLDDSVTSSKSLSPSKTSRRNSSTVSDGSSGREVRTRTAARSEERKESVKSSEISRGKAPSDSSSIAKRLRLSGKSNEKISRVRLDLKKHSIEDKTITKTPKELDSKVQDNTNESGSLRDDGVVEESIDTMENGSEIISELSRAEGNSKIGDSVLEDSKRPTDGNDSVTASNSLRGLMAESGYANDTFEDISSSTILSQREKMINRKKEVVDAAGSSEKKIDNVEQVDRSYQDNNKEHRDGLVITLNPMPKPSSTKVDPGSSNYVSGFESIVANADNVTACSIKLPQSAGSSSENQRKRYQRREASFRDENISSVGSSNKNTSDSSESSTGDVTKTDEKKNSPKMTTVRQESGRKERGEASNRARERAMIDVTGLPVANDEDSIKLANSNSSLEANEKGRERVFEQSLDQRISQNVEYVLRKSHRDALAKRHDFIASAKVALKASESPSDCKTVSETQNALKTRKVTAKEENDNCRSSEKNKVSNHNCREHNTKGKKKRARIMNSKSAGARDNTGGRKEDKASRLDGKQTRGLQKRIVELRLQQEREDLQKYLHELKDLRLESGSTRSYFRPLEFPKIAEFTQPDVNDLELKPDDQFRERVLAIRRWLKDQYVLYRDYCTMAQAINAHYVPTTLDDTKKTIRELRKTTIKNR
ncbi:uncharacterized protein LOC143908620 [Temnothorax americanus]|uniref:uncharacterized protein LOC143908620 n=1 Tax=Temnothorax americanus TaxID=1964332 RepID=UPI004067D734